VWQRTIIAALKFFVPRRGLFRWVVAAGNLARPLLPKQLAEQVPPLRMANPPSRRSGARTKTRRVILLQGCVQSVSAPGTNAHLEALLDRHGIEVIQLPREGCCGSLALHLGDEHAAIEAMRHNVRLIAPMLSHVEAVISTASGCGVTVKDYGRLLADTPEADAGREFAAKTRDAGEYLAHAGIEVSAAREERRVAWHAPCTLQHGQKSRGHVESLLTAAGYQLTAVTDPHLCCGSAGTYSILQPALSTRLRDNKLSALQSDGPELIATANIGCQLHLASAAQVPVVHWVQLLR
jgi:glycolate oxidase iron-sulfur subunit